jgi:dephospho-CoA kinase
VATDGTVDRAVLAERAFATPEDRHWLEQLLWPRVGERVMQWRAEVEARDPAPRAAVVEVPLLFEADLAPLYDATLAITAPEDVRAERAGARGHAAVDERHARQLPQEEKARRATHAVENDDSEAELEARLAAVLEKLRA